jgi:hypothetical protein
MLHIILVFAVSAIKALKNATFDRAVRRSSFVVGVIELVTARASESRSLRAFPRNLLYRLTERKANDIIHLMHICEVRISERTQLGLSR